MKFKLIILWLFIGFIGASQGQKAALSLWEGAAPGALGSASQDIPKITPFPAAHPVSQGTAMVIFPGGGYGGLAGHEGAGYAVWFNELGISAFVIQYRLGSHGYRHPTMLNDAARAVRTVRARAQEWGINPNRIGIIGSSAGGHLASTLLTHFDAGDPTASDMVERQSSRPDFGILCYPVVTMGAYTHQGSKRNLLGEKPDPQLVWSLSNELQVTPQTPPVFLWHTMEDTVVPLENSLQLAAALRQAGVPFAFHIYQKGRHGIGLSQRGSDAGRHHPWTEDCQFWMQANGWLP